MGTTMLSVPVGAAARARTTALRSIGRGAAWGASPPIDLCVHRAERASLALWEQGRAEWPSVDLPLACFVEWARTRLRFESANDLAAVPAGDAFLACACARGVPRAIELFAETYGPLLPTWLACVERRREAARDLAQELLVRLLFADANGGAPRIAEYSGRGPLRAWLRTIARRRALNVKRDRRRQAELAVLAADDDVPPDDPEHVFLRDRYAPRVGEALREALHALTGRDRVLLRERYAQGLGLGEIAARNGWSKPTACRRIAAARDALRDDVTSRVRASLGIAEHDVDGMLELCADEVACDLGAL